jgi:large subunit ribosomal protein L10
LTAQFAGIVASPLTGLARGLGAMISGLAIALGQVREQKEAAAPAAEEPAAQEPAAEDPAEEEQPAGPGEEQQPEPDSDSDSDAEKEAQ